MASKIVFEGSRLAHNLDQHLNCRSPAIARKRELQVVSGAPSSQHRGQNFTEAFNPSTTTSSFWLVPPGW